MKVETITVARTVQVRQYEPLVMSATASVEPGEPEIRAFKALLAVVMAALAFAQRPTAATAAQAAVEDPEFPFDPRD